MAASKKEVMRNCACRHALKKALELWGIRIDEMNPTEEKQILQRIFNGEEKDLLREYSSIEDLMKIAYYCTFKDLKDMSNKIE